MTKIFLSALIVLFHFQASATAVQEAYKASGIAKSDSLEVKIDKALFLLNEKQYFNPNDAQSKNVKSGSNDHYLLDSQRTAEQIFAEKKGGNCGSSAKAFAALLMEAGVSDNDLQIVSTVVPADLKIICPEVGKPRVENPQAGAQGHDFVAVRFPGKGWRLINPIDGSKTYGYAAWPPPVELQMKIKAAALVVPRVAFSKLPATTYGQGLVVFQSWSPKEVPLHTFEQRFDLIASGRITSAKDPLVKVCRFTAAK